MEVLRYAAFSADPAGGNPAGVVLDSVGASDAEMQAVAAEVGYSETAFLGLSDGARVAVRYFSPLAEVPFCGHATIASAVAYAERNGPGTLLYDTPAGEVRGRHPARRRGAMTATLTSVRAAHRRARRRRPRGRPGRAALVGRRPRSRRCRRASRTPVPGTRSSRRPPANGSPTSTTTSTRWVP